MCAVRLRRNDYSPARGNIRSRGEFTDLMIAHDEDIVCNTLVSDVKEWLEPIAPFDPNIIIYQK